MANVQNILDEVKIYVGTYGKYNDGSIAGEWLTLGDYSDLHEFYAACADLHSDEADPEYMFQDYEVPDILKRLISESLISANIYELAELLEDKDVDMIAAYIDATGLRLSENTIKEAEEKFFGEYDSETELAEDYADQTGLLDSMPENLQSYFDFERFGRDLAMDFTSFNGYYFNN